MLVLMLLEKRYFWWGWRCEASFWVNAERLLADLAPPPDVMAWVGAEDFAEH